MLAGGVIRKPFDANELFLALTTLYSPTLATAGRAAPCRLPARTQGPILLDAAASEAMLSQSRANTSVPSRATRPGSCKQPVMERPPSPEPIAPTTLLEQPNACTPQRPS